MDTLTSLWTEAMPNESLQFFAKINPLVGLPPEALRLYSALGVLKKQYSSCEEPEWFRVPESDQRLQNIRFSQQRIENAFQELVEVDLLQIREKHGTRWYRLT